MEKLLMQLMKQKIVLVTAAQAAVHQVIDQAVMEAAARHVLIVMPVVKQQLIKLKTKQVNMLNKRNQRYEF